MSRQTLVMVVVAVTSSSTLVAPANADISVSVLDFEDFPTNANFQTFNPHDPLTPTAAERTVREDALLPDGTRHITQSFQLESDLAVEVIDILFVRGASGNTGILRVFDVVDTTAADITNDYNNALTSGFLANLQFAMPPGLDPIDNTERTLRLTLTEEDQLTLPAKTAPAGYAFTLSSVVDDDPAVNNEVFTWRFGDPATGGGVGWYADGRVYYDDFVSSGNTETRRDGLFALSDSVTTPMAPGDYNENGVVDAADFVVWRKNVGSTTLPNRDENLTGPVGDDDYNFWKSRFGETSGNAALVVGSAVPEPQSLVLTLLAVLSGYRIDKRRSKNRA